MSDAIVATLRDGSQVPLGTLEVTTERLQLAFAENGLVLYDLAAKCRNAKYKFPTNPVCDARTILKKHQLIDKNENLDAYVRLVILNSLEEKDKLLQLVNPLQAKSVTLIK